jgi:NADPH-dependent 2,4-dienoyl-CoA reductase/sulfur reductase-like enzyme
MADFVIIGNGIAGRKAAETIRNKEHCGSILMITDELCPFYPRPRLSLGYISGEVEKDKLFLAPDLYSRKAVSLVFGKVVGVSPKDNRVLLEDGSEISYGSLLIASGASPAPPPWEGSTLDGVVGLRTLADADDIIRRSAEQKTIVVAGAGILGVEVAEALTKRGCAVNILVRGGQDKVGTPSLNPEQAVQRCQKMIDSGIRICTEEEIDRLEGDGKLERVVTKSGAVIETGLCVVTIGTRANLGFLKGSGIETERGVKVDCELKSVSFANVFAAGDSAEVAGDGAEKQRYGSPYVNATKQGEYAASKMIECLGV